MKKINMAVVFGGRNHEHEVSLKTSTTILRNADKEKYNLFPIGITREGRWMYYDGPYENIENDTWEEIAKDLEENHRKPGAFSLNIPNLDQKIDVAFPAIHGANGEDGTLQGLLEMAEVPYVGCRVFASAACLDKVHSKKIFEASGIPVTPYVIIYRKDLENEEYCINEIESNTDYPIFIKPANLGSSVGISKIDSREKLMEGLRSSSRYDRKLLIEGGVDCREIECAVIGNSDPIPSVLGEIVASRDFYDFDAKYSEEAQSAIIIPAKISDELTKEITEMAVKAYKAIDCTGLSRVDFFLDKKSGKYYLNEINTMPGGTKFSMFPMLWKESGISYTKIIDRLVEYALEFTY
jgi:D-alanine-D-alanine ligase